jgi:hypothetical protein
VICGLSIRHNSSDWPESLWQLVNAVIPGWFRIQNQKGVIMMRQEWEHHVAGGSKPTLLVAPLIMLTTARATTKRVVQLLSRCQPQIFLDAF